MAAPTPKSDPTSEIVTDFVTITEGYASSLSELQTMLIGQLNAYTEVVESLIALSQSVGTSPDTSCLNDQADKLKDMHSKITASSDGQAAPTAEARMSPKDRAGIAQLEFEAEANLAQAYVAANQTQQQVANFGTAIAMSMLQKIAARV